MAKSILIDMKEQPSILMNLEKVEEKPSVLITLEIDAFESSLIVYPLKGYTSFLSLQDAIKCVASRDPKNKFLTLTHEEQEAVLVSYSDTLTTLYNVPQSNLIDQLSINQNGDCPSASNFIYDTGDEVMIGGEKYTTMSDGSLKKLVIVTDAWGEEVFL